MSCCAAVVLPGGAWCQAASTKPKTGIASQYHENGVKAVSRTSPRSRHAGIRKRRNNPRKEPANAMTQRLSSAPDCRLSLRKNRMSCCAAVAFPGVAWCQTASTKPKTGIASQYHENGAISRYQDQPQKQTRGQQKAAGQPEKRTSQYHDTAVIQRTRLSPKPARENPMSCCAAVVLPGVAWCQAASTKPKTGIASQYHENGVKAVSRTSPRSRHAGIRKRRNNPRKEPANAMTQRLSSAPDCRLSLPGKTRCAYFAPSGSKAHPSSITRCLETKSCKSTITAGQ